MPNRLEGFGHLLETCREKKGYSREKLGELVSTSTKHIYNIEHREAVPSVPLLKRLVCTLDIPPVLVFYPATEYVESKGDEISRAMRLMDERELFIVQDVVDSLLRNRANDNSGNE